MHRLFNLSFHFLTKLFCSEWSFYFHRVPSLFFLFFNKLVQEIKHYYCKISLKSSSNWKSKLMTLKVMIINCIQRRKEGIHWGRSLLFHFIKMHLDTDCPYTRSRAHAFTRTTLSPPDHPRTWTNTPIFDDYV